MNSGLAQRLLANVMHWEPSDDAKERPILQSLAAFKYDDYEPFSPGMRFIESLALWLRQFQTLEERKIAYEFVKNKLIFISPKEMSHLVTIAYPDHIRPFLIRKVAQRTGISEWNIKRIAESLDFQILQRKSLFLALSDGAHIDRFRRSNRVISHEQVLRSHEIPPERAKEMIAKLKENLSGLVDHELRSDEAKFQCVFLVDDFSGSGLSYINKIGSSYQGKIWNFLKMAGKETIQDLFDFDELHVCLVLYLASTRAYDYIERTGKELFGKIPFDVLIVDCLPDSIRIYDQRDEALIKLFKKYYDPAIINKHYRMGRYNKPYLGFDECGLPLVLSHNAPNNSIALLWSPENHKFRGLFPRIDRHREEG